MEPATEETADVVMQEPNTEEWINITPDGGIQKCILSAGDGDSPPDGAEITCHYTGTLTDTGEKFDSSRDRNSPFNFTLGRGSVIKCWDQGIATMKVGERAILRCKAEYGYGENGSPPKIPGGASLDFDVQLLDWTDMKKVKDGIYKKVIKEGHGWKTPKDEARAIFNYVQKSKDGAELNVNENIIWDMDQDPNKFDDSFGACIKDLKLNEKSFYKITDLNSQNDDDTKTTRYYEIEMLSFENPKEEYDCKTTQEHFELANEYKQKGNTWFKKNNYSKALAKYEKAHKVLEHNYNFTDEEKEDAKKVKAVLSCNTSAVQLKLGNYAEALKKAQEALECDENNIKARTRCGSAHLFLGNFEEAKSHFKIALQLDADNQYVKLLLKRAKNEIKKYKEKQKKLYGNMFKK